MFASRPLYASSPMLTRRRGKAGSRAFGRRCASEMRQHRRIEQGLIARDGGGEAVRQRETRVSFQMRKEIAMRETLSRRSALQHAAL